MSDKAGASRVRLKVDRATAKAAHNDAMALLAEIAAYFLEEKKPINEIIFVPTTIMSRIIRTHEAIELLLSEKFYSEAAVLVLTQFELRFDLLYVATDIKRATQWVEHENPKSTAISMKSKLGSLFKPQDANFLYETFGYLSGIKHGNPLYSELAFPNRWRRGYLSVTTGPIDDRFAKVFSEALFAYSTFQLVWSTQAIHKVTAQYASVKRETRQRVQDRYLAMKNMEDAFRRFLAKKIATRETFFGMKQRVRKKPDN